MNKKAIAILGAIFLLIMGTLGFLIYSKYGSNTPATTTSNGIINNNFNPNNTVVSSSTTGTQNPSATSSLSIFRLSDDAVVSPVLFYNGKGISYFTSQGQLYLSDIAEGSPPLQLSGKKTLDIPVKSGISKILWPSKGNNFIAEVTGTDGTRHYSFYNSLTNSYTDFPPQIISVDWLPSADKIVFIWSQNGKAVMELSDPDTKNWKKIADMWEPDDSLHVSPDGQSVLYYQMSNAGSTNNIVQTTPDGKFWKGLIKTGYNYGVLWSPDSKKFLFGKRDLNTQETALWIYDMLAGEAKNTGLKTTPEKTVWGKDSKAFYAAVPTSGVPGNGNVTVDYFTKVDAETFTQKQYQTGDSNIDGRDLFLSMDNAKLFFKNAQDGALYYLDLNQ